MKKSFPFTGGFGKKPLEEKIESLLTLNVGLEQRLKDEQQKHSQYQRHSRERLDAVETTCSKLREDNSTLTAELRELREKLPALSTQNAALKAELKAKTEQLEDTREDALAGKEEIDVLNAANFKLRQKLSEQDKTIFELSEETKSLEDRRIYLEEVIAWFNEKYEQLNSGAFDDHEAQRRDEIEMVQKLETAEALTVELCTSVEALKAEIEELNAQSREKMDELKGEKESLRMELQLQIKRLEAEKEALDASLRTRINELETENDLLYRMRSDMRTHESVLRKNTPQTLRALLVLRYLETKYPVSTPDDDVEPAEPNRSWPALPQGDLDTVYSPPEFDRVAEILRPGTPFKRFYKQLRLKTCRICSKPRIKSAFTNTPLTWLNEFPAQGSSFNCCSSKVCRKCFVDYLVETVQHGWWHKLGSLQWIPCPSPGCGSALDIRCSANFELCLERNKAPNVEVYMKM